MLRLQARLSMMQHGSTSDLNVPNWTEHDFREIYFCWHCSCLSFPFWSSSVPEELKGLLADKCIQTELDILSCCESQELNKYWMHFTSRVDTVSVENMSANVKCVETPFLREIVHNCKKKKPFLSTVCSKQWKLGIDCVLMKFKVLSWSIGYHL